MLEKIIKVIVAAAFLLLLCALVIGIVTIIIWLAEKILGWLGYVILAVIASALVLVIVRDGGE